MVVLNFFIQAIKILFLLGLLVIIHEGGHFTVAKLFKIPVAEFSVGFGKKLWSKQRNGTEYSLRMIPLGGFVDLGDDSRDGEFAKAALYKKNLILLAGVFVNFVFALILAFIILFAQKQYITNVIDELVADTPIVNSGIQPGDEIYKIDGRKIKDKTGINAALMNKYDNVVVDVKRNGEIYSYNVEPIVEEYIITGFSIDEERNVVKLHAGYNYDIKVGDKLVSINDEKVEDIDTVVEKLKVPEDGKIKIGFERNGETIEENVKITLEKKSYLGVVLKEAEPTFINGVIYASNGTAGFLIETLRGLKDLITRENDNAQLMGIVGVSDVITKTSSVLEYLSIMASVSLSLAFANLIPLPILDGGKIVQYTIEKIRKKEFSEKFMNVSVSITMALLIALTIYIMVKDILKIVA